MSTEYQHSDWFVPRRQSFVPNARRVTGQLVFVGKIWERTFFGSPCVGHRINRPHVLFYVLITSGRPPTHPSSGKPPPPYHHAAAAPARIAPPRRIPAQEGPLAD